MAFVAEAALIALREGLEALLITGILLGLVTRLGRPDARKHVYAGFAAAIVASLALGLLVQRYLLEPFEEQGGAEWFELGAVAVAVVVLTYMVFWMWQHTRALMTGMRRQVERLLTRGALLGIVVLTFASVVREGVEVVLFYGALAGRYAPLDLAWSGLVGLIVSAFIVLAILKGAGKVDLQGFFGVTGLLLVFVAGGLLVHGVSAAMGLGLLPAAPAVWDTSDVLPDESAPGRVLHALVGYAATPTLLQALLYFGYVFGVGGTYLWHLGAFHRRAAGTRSLHRGRAAAGALAVLVAAITVSAGAASPGALVTGHSHADGDGDGLGHEFAAATIPDDLRVGILLRSHGEPVHYNETTYRSFAEFVENLLLTLGYGHLLAVDQGTVLLDKTHPFEKGARLDAQLMDAWTRDHPGPAVYVGSPFPAVAQLPLVDAVYLAPGGPGLGEPDILEAAGLGAYRDWLQMDNASPMHFSKLRVLDAARAMLEARHGDRVIVHDSYHMRPHAGPGETDADAGARFRDGGVDLVIDAYTSAIFSDVMNTCMMRPHAEHALAQAGYRGPIAHAEPAGLTHTYAHAAGSEVAARLAEYPAQTRVAIFLTHHGMTPGAANPCGSGDDQYNANAAQMFAVAKQAVAEETGRDDLLVLQVYGQGAESADDGVLSPMEALEAARAAGATHVLDLPYELTGNGYDNLVAQRASYGLTPATAPHYDEDHETRLMVKGLDVRILSAAYGTQARAAALVEVIEHALADALDAGSAKGGDHRHDAPRAPRT